MVKQSLACFLLATLAVNCVFSQSCSLDPDDTATNVDVLILGAGISGIAAARTLEVNGVTSFLVLEANDRIGGRITEYENTSVEVGANWIHGIDHSDPKRHPIWREWVECDADGPDGSNTPDFTRVYDVSGNLYDIDNDNETYRKTENEFLTAYDEAEELGDTITNDISFRQALSMGGWEPQSSLENFIEWSHIDLCSAVRPENMSLLRYLQLTTYTDYLGQEEDAEAEDYLFADDKGYSFVVECLARNFKNDHVLLNSLVSSIRTAGDCVCVTVQEKLYCGKYAIVTFSIGALQAAIRGEDAAVRFDPPLPHWKQDAINNVLAVHYGKIHLLFEKAFWNETDDDQQIFGYVSDQKGYYGYYILDKNRPNTITVDVAENLALKVASQSDETTVSEVMTILRKMFSESIPEPQTAIISKWSNDPLFRHAYTSFAPGVPEDLFDDLLNPVNERLYFAGEGVNSTAYGYTHGGYGSGVHVAKLVSSNLVPSQVVNDTLTGDPLMTIPIFTAPNVSAGDAVPSLCYEVHGAANQYFNLITDECTAINAYYEKVQRNSSSIDINIVTKIGVRAVGDSGTCRNVEVDLEMCNTVVDGIAMDNLDSDGIKVKRYVGSSRVRISIPNCADTVLVMWVFCRSGKVRDPVTSEYYNTNFIRYVVMRGFNLNEKSHGLIGQFWNVPVTVVPFEGNISGKNRTNDYVITVKHPDSEPRSFVGLRHEITWESEMRVCYYVGDRQAGKLGGVSEPNDSVIEGSYRDYRVDSLFATNFTYTHFNNERCA